MILSMSDASFAERSEESRNERGGKCAAKSIRMGFLTNDAYERVTRLIGKAFRRRESNMELYRSERSKKRFVFLVAFSLSAAVFVAGFILMGVYGLHEDGGGFAGSMFFLGLVASVITAIGAFRMRTPEQKHEDIIYYETKRALSTIAGRKNGTGDDAEDENVRLAVRIMGKALRYAVADDEYIYAIPAIRLLGEALRKKYHAYAYEHIRACIREYDPPILEAICVFLEIPQE